MIKKKEFKGIFLGVMMLVGSFYAQALEKATINLQDLPFGVISIIFDKCATLTDRDNLLPPMQLARVHSKINRALKTNSPRYREYQILLQKLGSKLYLKELIYAPEGLGPDKPQTSLSFREAVKNDGVFDLGKISNSKVKFYNQFVLSPMAFFESKFKDNIILITTVGAIKAENARIKDTDNAKIYQLDKLLEAWEEKWKDKDLQLKYDDSDMVVFARWGEDPLKEYKYFTAMFPKQDFLNLQDSKRSLYELLGSAAFSRQNGAGRSGSEGRWWVMGRQRLRLLYIF